MAIPDICPPLTKASALLQNGTYPEQKPETKLEISQKDITTFDTDAIVNAANTRMLGGGGVDGAIHAAAGYELLKACKLHTPDANGVRCPVGEARITAAGRLPCKHVIHTVGPVFSDYEATECDTLLRNAFVNSTLLAKENLLTSIAFPAISCGVYGFPVDRAARIALKAVSQHAVGFSRVCFVLFSERDRQVWLHEAQQMPDLWVPAGDSNPLQPDTAPD